MYVIHHKTKTWTVQLSIVSATQSFSLIHKKKNARTVKCVFFILSQAACTPGTRLPQSGQNKGPGGRGVANNVTLWGDNQWFDSFPFSALCAACFQERDKSDLWCYFLALSFCRQGSRVRLRVIHNPAAYSGRLYCIHIIPLMHSNDHLTLQISEFIPQFPACSQN